MNKEKTLKITDMMRKMRLPAMAEQLFTMMESNELLTMNALELIDKLTETEYLSRRNNTIHRYKKGAKLSQATARLKEIDYSLERQINKEVISQLQTNDYVQKSRNVIIMGSTGVGKPYIANALGNNACEDCYSTAYLRHFEFFNACHRERIETGSEDKIIRKYMNYDLLILDDFLLHTLKSNEIDLLFKLIEYRYDHKSTIICSQFEPSEWHARLGGSVVADSIIERLKHNAYTLVVGGESLRK